MASLSSMASFHDGVHDGIDRLSTLPAELAVTIFKYLPAIRDICRSRSLNRRTKDVIDENQADILRPLIAEHRRRIATDYNNLHCNGSLEVKDVYQSFIDYYGVVKNEQILFRLAHPLFNHYVAQKYPQDHQRSAGMMLETLFVRATLSMAILKISSAFDLDPTLMPSCFKWLAQTVDDGELATGYEKMKEANHSKAARGHLHLEYPQHYLKHNPVLHSGFLKMACEAEVSNGFLQTLEIPSVHFPNAAALCIKNHRMWELAKKCDTGDREMSLFEMAGLLEAIFLW